MLRSSASSNSPETDSSAKAHACYFKPSVSWQTRVQSLMRARHAISKKQATGKDLEVLCDFLLEASPALHGCPHLSKNVHFARELLMSDPTILEHHTQPDRFFLLHDQLEAAEVSGQSTPLLTDPQSSRLSLLVGLLGREPFSAHARTAAKAQVYYLGRYRPDTAWGPFMGYSLDEAHLRGQYVDWSHLEALMVVAGSNAYEIYNEEGHIEDEQLFPHGLDFTRPFTAPDASEGAPSYDWAGVTGSWRRIVSFLDYRDLWHYNMQRRIGKNPFLALCQEAVRLLSVDLQITSVDEDPHLTGFPTLHFIGKSEGGRPHESKLRGSVSKMLDGNIRWDMVSSYGGEDRWSSVGVQVGGQQSGAGIYGVWTGVTHEIDDPAGPFMLFKRRRGDEE